MPEIAARVGLTVQGARRLVQRLRARGYVITANEEVKPPVYRLAERAEVIEGFNP